MYVYSKVYHRLILVLILLCCEGLLYFGYKAPILQQLTRYHNMVSLRYFLLGLTFMNSKQKRKKTFIKVMVTSRRTARH